MAADNLDKEARQRRSETQLLREQLELALHLNNGDFQAFRLSKFGNPFLI